MEYEMMEWFNKYRIFSKKSGFHYFALLFFIPALIFSEEKNPERIAWTGLPLPSYNSDDGFGFGARVYATRYSESFAPYKWQMWIQYYKTTKKRENHEFKLDFLEGPGMPFRMILRGGYVRYQSAQFYGYGNYQNIKGNQKIVSGEIPVLDNLPRDQDVLQFDGKYGEEISLNSAGGINPGRRILRERQNKYFMYDRVEPYGMVSFENWIASSRFKWWTAFRSTRYSIGSYYRDRDDGEAEQNGRTKIDIDQPTGYDALEMPRFVNFLRLALVYDSRPKKREKNPDSGILSDVHTALSGKTIGSAYTYYKTTITHRQYINLFKGFLSPRNKELVFAYRLLGQKTVGEAPFFEFGRIYTFIEDSEGLGGTYGIRGYPSNQFVDRVMALANTELRYTFSHKNWLGGMDWILLGFYDTGRVAPEIRDMTAKGMHMAWGGGIRVVWQENTVINISTGVSKYESFTAFSFSHMF